MIFITCNFSLFMIFMNFIITMIGESYGKVKDYADAYNYKERVQMIYEREIHFSENDLVDPIYFPKILIVRKKKCSDNLDNDSL